MDEESKMICTDGTLKFTGSSFKFEKVEEKRYIKRSTKAITRDKLYMRIRRQKHKERTYKEICIITGIDIDNLLIQ